MTFHYTNFLVLTNWQLAHAVAGTAMQSLFGLDEEELAVVAAASVEEMSRWSSLPRALVQPRFSLLPTLRADSQPRLMGYIAQGRDPALTPILTRFPQPVNEHLLTVWQQTATNPAPWPSFRLEAADLAALDGVETATLLEWSGFPMSLAIPRPGLLQQLAADLDPLSSADPSP